MASSARFASLAYRTTRLPQMSSTLACFFDRSIRVIRIGPISPVIRTCVPPQADRSYAEISITRTSPVLSVGLRKPTERTGDVRVIDISGYDRSACGGTHVRMTGEIGPILITRIERSKKQARVEFICGNRVVRYAREANRALEAISQTISSPPLETASAVRTLWDEHQQMRKRLEDLESELLDHEAAQFPVKDGIAAAAFKGRSIEKIKILAVKICARPSVVALLADETDGQLRVVFARS